MLVGFKTNINNKPTFFKEKILAPYCDEYKDYTPKLHTIREKWRFKEGDKLHMKTGSRYKPVQFNQDIPELQKVVCTEILEIYWKKPNHLPIHLYRADVWINNVFLLENEIEILAKNDGFDSAKEFFEFFNKDFEGQIVHWTDLRYDKEFFDKTKL